MKIADLPLRFAIPFANTAGAPQITYPVPDTSATPGRASKQLGFPPINFIPRGSGGIPPFGQDFNGILKQITLWSQWQAAGGALPYDPTFQTAISGYPKGTILANPTNPLVRYQCLNDDNITDPTAAGAGWLRLRQQLSADTNFYVSAAGNDSNDGLTPGTAWATIQHAFDILVQYYDAGFVYKMIVNIGAGTFPGGIINGGLIGVGFNNRVQVVGAGSSTTISTPLNFSGMAYATLTNFKMGGGAFDCVRSSDGAEVSIGANIEFMGVTGLAAHIYCSTGGIVTIGSPYTISGGAGAHYQAFGSGSLISIASGINITLTGTPNFTGSFVAANFQSLIALSGTPPTFIGSATGVRYNIDNLTLISSGGTISATYFPGSIPGVNNGHGAVYN